MFLLPQFRLSENAFVLWRILKKGKERRMLEKNNNKIKQHSSFWSEVDAFIFSFEAKFST